MSEDGRFPPVEDDESRTYAALLRQRFHRDSGASPRLSGGDPDARWDQAEGCGDETACASAATPDQNVVEEIAAAVGIHYDDSEELKFGTKEHERDVHRWELDPASAEDYREREMELVGAGPSEPLLSMTHRGHRPHKHDR